MEDRYKGHDVLVRALPLIRAKVPDVHWVVIGDGPLRPGLEQLARSHEVADAVASSARSPMRSATPGCAAPTCSSMPSRLPAGGFAGEGFGIVYLEAAAYGKPVVAGNVGGRARRRRRRRDGAAGRPRRPSRRGRRDREAAARSASWRARLGDAGAERAREFAWPEICARVEAVLLERLGMLG